MSRCAAASVRLTSKGNGVHTRYVSPVPGAGSRQVCARAALVFGVSLFRGLWIRV